MIRINAIGPVLSILAVAGAFALTGGEAAAENPVVIIKTTLGVIEVELYPNWAPKTVENFLTYVDDEFYDFTIFHRVIRDFMIQGGGMTSDMKEKTARGTIDNEGKDGLSNERGTIAMARKKDVHSAQAQFFINHKDNPKLDDYQGYGYCVFGKVVSGMDVVDAIANVNTTTVKGPPPLNITYQNVPEPPVLIEFIRRKKPE